MQWHRHPRLWLLLALAVVFTAAAALWLCDGRSGGERSPLSTPAASEGSPLATPTPGNATSSPPSSWTTSGAVLIWIMLGILLALVIAFVILRGYRHAA